MTKREKWVIYVIVFAGWFLAGYLVHMPGDNASRTTPVRTVPACLIPSTETVLPNGLHYIASNSRTYVCRYGQWVMASHG